MRSRSRVGDRTHLSNQINLHNLLVVKESYAAIDLVVVGDSNAVAFKCYWLYLHVNFISEYEQFHREINWKC